MAGSDQLTVEALIGVIGTLQAQLETQRLDAVRERTEARLEISRLVAMVEGLTRQLDALLGEKHEAQRLELARLREEAVGTGARAAAAEPEPDPEPEPGSDSGQRSPGKSSPKRHPHGRAPLPEHLERDIHTIRPATCDTCGSTRLEVRETRVTEERDYVRAHLRVRRTVRTVCTCLACNRLVVPELPPMPFDRASCTFALMAWVCFAKTGLFLPLDRLCRDFADQGSPIPSATLNRWWQRGADLLGPVAGAVRLSLLAGTHIRTDGTGLRVVFPRVKGSPVKGDPRPGETDDDGYLLARDAYNGQILIFGDDRHAVYHFTKTKEGQHALDFLTLGVDEAGQPIVWSGTITADAVSAQDCLFRSDERTESGCNAHGLRKFRDDADKAPLLASRALAFIARFYTEEAKARELGLNGPALLAHRVTHTAPVVADFRVWLEAHIEELLPTNPVRKAMQYYLNHWGALTRFLSDADVPLDNNWSERALRKVNLIRNNSLYAGGEEGARRLCTLLTLVHTARQLGVDPFAYLEWALTRVVPHSTNRGLGPSALTPAAYKAAQERSAHE